MSVQRTLKSGETLFASTDTGLETLKDLESAEPAWCVIEGQGVLHVKLGPDTALPAGIGAPTPLWNLAASLTGPFTASLAIATGPALDAAGVVTPLGADAAAEASALARHPVPTLEDGADAIWDRLAHIARRAQSLTKDRRILAAALTFKGRGRLIGPITGDLLIRFGVSTWR
jgi:hypothetical protein